MAVTSSGVQWDSQALLAAIINIPPAPVFFTRRLFSIEATTRSNLVGIDTLNGEAKLSPFVGKRKKGIAIQRPKVRASLFEPPRLAPVLPFSADELYNRQPGYSQFDVDAAARAEGDATARDLSLLSLMNARRIEFMTAQCLSTGLITCTDDDDNRLVAEIDYRPINTFVPTVLWSAAATCKPLDDLRAMMRLVNASGYAASLVVFGSKAADAWEASTQVQNAMSTYHNLSVQLSPEQMRENDEFGVTMLGSYRGLPLFVSEAVFTQKDGTSAPYWPENLVLVAATGLQSQVAFCGIAQVADDEGSMSVIEGANVPQLYYEAGSDSRSLRLSSRPVPIPSNLNTWCTGNVL